MLPKDSDNLRPPFGYTISRDGRQSSDHYYSSLL